MLLAVRFLLEDGTVQQGELVNPFRVEGSQVLVEERDGQIDVLVSDFDGTFYATSVHMSRVASIRELTDA